MTPDELLSPPRRPPPVPAGATSTLQSRGDAPPAAEASDVTAETPLLDDDFTPLPDAPTPSQPLSLPRSAGPMPPAPGARAARFEPTDFQGLPGGTRTSHTPPPIARDSLASTPPGGRPPWSPLNGAPSQVQRLKTLHDVALAVQELMARVAHVEGGLERNDRRQIRFERSFDTQAERTHSFQSLMARDFAQSNENYSGMWHTVHALAGTLDAHRMGSATALQTATASIEASIKKSISEANQEQSKVFRAELEKRTGPWVLLKAVAPILVLGLIQFLVTYFKR